MPAGDLRTFVDVLRVRLERGDLHNQRGLWLTTEITLTDMELGVQVLLADVDYYTNLPPAQPERYP